MNRLLVIAHVLGGMLMVFSATFALPFAWSIAVHDGSYRSFLVASAACLVVGALLWLVTRPYRRELEPRDGCLLVVLGWLTMSLAGAVPLLLEIPGLSFTDAYFEAVAGLTTTGSTILDHIERLPQSVNVWRHAMQWYGGMGIIVMAVAILPLLGVGGMQLFRNEMPGPMKENRLTPRITQTAKYLWLVYTGLTGACIVALHWAGLDWFESVCHAFSAMSLGGFSTRDASIAAIESPAVEAVLTVFMLIAVLNFFTHSVALRQRSLLAYWRDPEAPAVWGLLIGSAIALGVYLHWTGEYPSLVVSLRHALFNTVSLGTTTGFVSQDYASWPLFAPLWLLFLACVGSSAGSTGGGIKMIRSLILIKQARRELTRLVHPRAIAPLTLNGQIVDNRIIFSVLGYMLLWGLTQLALALVLLAVGEDFLTAVSAAVATVNNVGPALGRYGPTSNYAAMSDFETWLLAFAMLAGRLELLTFFVIFTPAFWRR
ncbi:MAG: TrkH family potassium uptake protein [Burkholderiaceae bacterium]|nr:TrkH family potassium uptake protein [Burkholderiaceae bacterium]MCD6672356.1 TrkH family potassium uptake protein [Burkholderiaceae bacterium]